MRPTLFATLIIAAATAGAADVDDFSTAQGPVVDTDGSGLTPASDTALIAGVPGGQRTLFALTSVTTGQSSAAVGGGQFSGTIGPIGEIAPFVALLYGGMGAFDLTFAGTEDRLAFRVTGATGSTDATVDLTLRVEDSDGDSDVVPMSVGSGMTTFDEVIEFPFSGIDGTVDLDSVDSLRLQFFNISATSSASLQISLLESTPVELSSFAIE